MHLIESHKCCGGVLQGWEHKSDSLGCNMKFSIFLPKEKYDEDTPVLTYLSGLTCTHDNFTTKAGAYQKAAELGIAIVAPDTSPRGDNIPDDQDSYDFGKGAGFYINATQAPWDKHYQMETYITQELFDLIPAHFKLSDAKQGILGHSMGGHGALTLFFKHQKQYKSVSAFSPIVAPTQVPWGHKAFSRYLGDNQQRWKEHDACELVMGSEQKDTEILIDQGLSDNFLEEQLKPELFQAACEKAGQAVKLRMHEGYDHSYYFIQSFIEDHLQHHASYLR